MKPNQLTTAIISVLVSCCAVSVAADAPRVFLCDGKDLAMWKQRAAANDPVAVKIVEEIRAEADKALQVGTFSVVNKPFTPPSGDKHDYMSLSPYWWADPDKADGLPYIRRDGEINPERAQYDLQPMEDMANAVGALSMAYFLTGEEPYAEKASELIRVWFINPDTRMNPNVKYAQFVPGRDEIRAAGIIETNRIRKVVDADGLLHGSPAWSSDDSAKLKAWYREFLDYLLTSDQGIREAAAKNNHGTWYGVQTAGFALYVGDEDLAKQLIKEHGIHRIAEQIEPDGSQPEELARTNGYDYSRYNILAYLELAMLGDRVGIDLWNYKTDDGRSIRQAIDWLLPYALDEKPWEYQQISPRKMRETATVLRRAANGMNEPRYEQAIKRLPGVDGTSTLTELYFPSRLDAAKQATSR